MVTSYNNSIAALDEQAQHHANHHPHQGHNQQEDEVGVTTAVKPQSKASASYKPKPGPSPHHLLLVVRRVNAFQRIYSWWSWKKAPWLVYAWSCSSSCVRVDVFLDFGPDLDLVGITSSSSSVDLTCADLTDEAGADSAGDLSGTTLNRWQRRKLWLQLLRLSPILGRRFRRNSKRDKFHRTLPCHGFSSRGGRLMMIWYREISSLRIKRSCAGT